MGKDRDERQHRLNYVSITDPEVDSSENRSRLSYRSLAHTASHRNPRHAGPSYYNYHSAFRPRRSSSRLSSSRRSSSPRSASAHINGGNRVQRAESDGTSSSFRRSRSSKDRQGNVDPSHFPSHSRLSTKVDTPESNKPFELEPFRPGRYTEKAGETEDSNRNYVLLIADGSTDDTIQDFEADKDLEFWDCDKCTCEDDQQQKPPWNTWKLKGSRFCDDDVEWS